MQERGKPSAQAALERDCSTDFACIVPAQTVSTFLQNKVPCVHGVIHAGMPLFPRLFELPCPMHPMNLKSLSASHSIGTLASLALLALLVPATVQARSSWASGNSGSYQEATNWTPAGFQAAGPR